MDSLEITLQQGHRRRRSAAANEEQLRNAGDRRLRPPANLSRRSCLNRWIVPLEKRHDYLRLAQRAEDSRALRPVHRLLHEPRAEGPGRRGLPAANSLQNRDSRPDERAVPRACSSRRARSKASSFDCVRVGLSALAALRRDTNRPMRFCHPRDLVHQISIFCRFRGTPPALSRPAIDAAASDYFSVMGT